MTRAETIGGHATNALQIVELARRPYGAVLGERTVLDLIGHIEAILALAGRPTADAELVATLREIDRTNAELADQADGFVDLAASLDR